MKQKRESRRPQSKPKDKVEAEKVASAPPETVTADLLDEIDTVLEANSEEFVLGFVQRGGQ